MVEHKVLEVDGIEVLAIKWQDDDQHQSIRLMAYVGGIYAETELGFKSEEGRDKVWEERLESSTADFVALAKSATGHSA